MTFPVRRAGGSGSATASQLPSHVAFGIPAGLCGSLVVQLLGRPGGDLSLDETALEIEAQRHQHPSPLRDLRLEPRYLAPVEQKLAGAHRIVIGAIAELVWVDVALHEPRLSPSDRGVGVGHTDSPLATGLDLGPGKSKTSFDGVFNADVEAGLAILGNELGSGFLHLLPISV